MKKKHHTIVTPWKDDFRIAKSPALSIAATACAFVAIFAVLVYVRMIPAVNNHVEFKLDAAFNYRMTESVLATGDVPDVDVLSTYPQGKKIKAFLPTWLYYATATFHTVVNRVKTVPLDRTLLYFCALFGALIMVPAYLLSYDTYKNKAIACVTAFLAGIIPAYLNRTTCYWFRYEVMALPVLFTSLFFFIKACAALREDKTSLYAAASAVLMIASLFIWRLSVLFLVGYVCALIFLWVKYQKTFGRIQWIVVASVAAVYALLLFAVPGFGTRAAAIDYGSFPKAALEIISSKIASRQDFSDFTRLVFYNQELGGVSIKSLFDWLFLSLSGLFAAVFIIAYFFRKERMIQKDILFIFVLFFGVITFIFSRNKAVLGPLVAMTMGESVSLAMRVKNIATRSIAIALIALVIGKTGYDAYRLAVTRYVNTKLDPALAECVTKIKALTPPDAVFLSYWADGYPIQTYCGRATLTDGLFESPEIVRRIIAESKAYYSYNEKDLRDFCARYGATHVLVPNYRKMSYAGYAGVEYRLFFVNNKPTPLGRLTTLCKMMYYPGELVFFKMIFRNKEFVLYQVL